MRRSTPIARKGLSDAQAKGTIQPSQTAYKLARPGAHL
jgi:hypothetical protein